MKHDLQAALAALALSGAAALGHQLLWMRRMTDLLGAGSQASARVIGCFFLGLAIGAALAALWMPRIRNRWRMAAAIELSAALLCLPILFLPSVSDWLWPMFGPERIGSWQVDGIRLLISGAVVIPPAAAIGMSLPMIMGAVRRNRLPLATRSIVLYCVYTAGSALGLAWVVGVALQSLGARGAMLSMIVLNVAAAGVCGWRSARDEAVGPGQEPVWKSPAPVTEGVTSSLWLGCLAAFFSGAGILAVEVLSIELVNLTAPLAFYPQSAILFSAVMLLAIAAAVASRLVLKIGSVTPLISWVCAVTGLLMALIPLIYVHGIASRVAIGYGSSMGGFVLQMLGAGVAILGAPLLVGGMLFPFLMVYSQAHYSSRLAWLLSANGLGGLLGAEFAVRALLPLRGVHVALGLLGGLYAVAALAWVVVAVRNPAAGWSRLVPPLGALAACVLIILGPLSELRVFIDAPEYRVIDVSSSRDGSLAVVERNDLGRAMIFDNQYLLGASAARADMQRQTHLPLLLHPDPRRIAFLGLGTGITGSAALQHGPVESITAVEISPLVARAAEQYFPDLNDQFSSHPKVRILVDDARTYILSAVSHFDVIIGDLFTPWRPGESRLCTLEQFQAARRALRPRGLFCQWLPMHQLTREQFDIIAATFRQAFPRTYVFRNHFKTYSVPLALIGFADGELNWETARERLDAERARGAIRDPLCRHLEGLAMFCLGELVPGRTSADYNTLGNLRIELAAGRNLILKGYDAFLTGTSRGWSDFVQGQLVQLAQGTVMPDPLRTWPSLGTTVSRFDLAVREGDRSAESWREAILKALPPEIQDDAGADWSLWSGEIPLDAGPAR